MILNLQDFPTLSTLPITADEISAALMGPHDLDGNVWERNVTHSLYGAISVEVCLRLEVESGPLWLTVDALRRITPDDTVGFWIRSVEGLLGQRQTIAPSPNELATESLIGVLNALSRPTIQSTESLIRVGINQRIGDTTCANNARSPYLRCAVNPCGPCEDCKFYE